MKNFLCTKETCTWNSNPRILIHENNSNCYVPTTSTANDKFMCDAVAKGKNCYGQRFNQVCPCVLGCNLEVIGKETCVSLKNHDALCDDFMLL